MRVLLLIIAVSILAATTTAMFSSIPLPQSVSAATTTTKNANFLTYQNSTYGVKLKYPSSWGVLIGANTLDEKGNLVQPIDIADIAPPIESDPNAVAYLQIGVEQAADTCRYKEHRSILTQHYQCIQVQFNRLSIVSATTHATLAGKQAYSLVFTDTYQGFPTKSMIRGIVDGDKNYYLLFTSEAAKFDSFVPTVQKND